MGARIEPSADIRASARHIRELFLALLEQGFTEAQASSILGTMLGTAMASSTGDQQA